MNIWINIFLFFFFSHEIRHIKHVVPLWYNIVNLILKKCKKKIVSAEMLGKLLGRLVELGSETGWFITKYQNIYVLKPNYSFFNKIR